MTFTYKEKGLLYKSADPYAISLHINELISSGQNERALEFIKAAYESKVKIIEKIKQKLEDLLDDTKAYNGIMKRTVRIKSVQTQLTKEMYYLDQYKNYYFKITGELIPEKDEKTK